MAPRQCLPNTTGPRATLGAALRNPHPGLAPRPNVSHPSVCRIRPLESVSSSVWLVLSRSSHTCPSPPPPSKYSPTSPATAPETLGADLLHPSAHQSSLLTLFRPQQELPQNRTCGGNKYHAFLSVTGPPSLPRLSVNLIQPLGPRATSSTCT